ncbi:MAG TPA: TfpX/TfpZ family type IV pilin accessory protein [Candidatus Competibacter sp.]|nr:TfpX/TfpZ family type IV pilin accessory protein [Candidatus Competibacter sp.]
MTKLRAFAIHLVASTIIFLIFLGIMLLAWYPNPYFEVDGGWIVLKVLISVDLVLGPLLTLILFKPGKPGLRFDMGCIILMQLGALLYGGTIIYHQRPLFVVFAVDRFTTIPASEIDLVKLQHPELKHAVDIHPFFAQAHFPEDPKARQDIMFAVLSGREKDIEFRPELYEPYRPDLQQLKSRSIDIQQITTLDAQAKQAVERFITRQGGRLEDYLYLPLKGKNKDIVMVLSPTDGMPAGFISISPWIEDYRKPAAAPSTPPAPATPQPPQ